MNTMNMRRFHLRAPTRRSHGFTLIEILISLALLVLLAGLLMGFLWNLSRDRRAILNVLQVQRAADVLIDRLEQDLAGAIASSADGAGIVGTEDDLFVRTRGVFLVAPGASSGSNLGDEQTLSIRFNADTGTVVVSRTVAGHPAGDDDTLTDRVAKLRFRYHAGDRWRTSFNSERAGELPVAVEIALWFVSAGGESPVPLQTDDAELFRVEHDEPRDGLQPFDDLSLEDEPSVDPSQVREPDRVRVIIVPDGPSGTWSAFGSSGGNL